MRQLPREVERHDPQFAPFWEGTDAGEIRVQRCPECGRYRWPPRPMCPSCQTASTDWVAVPGDGILFSWIDVRHQTVRGVPSPYPVGLVELPGLGVRLLGQVAEADPEELEIGMPLVARFDATAAGVTLVNWRPRGDSGASADGEREGCDGGGAGDG